MPDLTLARSDLAAFAAMVGRPLEAWQVEALRLEQRVAVIVAPRQSGKSLSLAVLALHRALQHPEHRVLLLSAGEEGARRLLREVRAIATGSALLRGSVVDELAGLLTLSNGSEVRSVPASAAQIRGWSVDTLLVDEAALVPTDLLLGAALPTTAARPNARIVLASSAITAQGAFYDFAVQGTSGSEHTQTFKWGLADAWWISPSVIAAARESMSAARFGAEFEGVFAGSADQFVSRARLERAVVAYVPTALGELRPAARMTLGLDWGARHDRSAAVVVGRLAIPSERPVFGVVCAHRWKAGYRMDLVAEEVAGSPGHFAALVSEAVGLGLAPTERLFDLLRRRADDAGGWRTRRWRILTAQEDLREDERRRRGRGEPGRPEILAAAAARPGLEGRFETERVAAMTSQPLKAAGYGALRMLLDRGQLLIPAGAEDLVRELLMLRVDLTLSGAERIEASVGEHDDLPDAFMLALGPHKREGRWTTWLGRLAEQRLPEPVLPPEAAGLETVEGPGGLAVPRTPIWMSVAGSELTLPAVMPPVPPSAAQQRVWALRDRVTELSRQPTTTSPKEGTG